MYLPQWFCTDVYTLCTHAHDTDIHPWTRWTTASSHLLPHGKQPKGIWQPSTVASEAIGWSCVWRRSNQLVEHSLKMKYVILPLSISICLDGSWWRVHRGYHTFILSFGKVFNVEKWWKLVWEMGSGTYRVVVCVQLLTGGQPMIMAMCSPPNRSAVDQILGEMVALKLVMWVFEKVQLVERALCEIMQTSQAWLPWMSSHQTFRKCSLLFFVCMCTNWCSLVVADIFSWKCVVNIYHNKFCWWIVESIAHVRFVLATVFVVRCQSSRIHSRLASNHQMGVGSHERTHLFIFYGTYSM